MSLTGSDDEEGRCFRDKQLKQRTAVTLLLLFPLLSSKKYPASLSFTPPHRKAFLSSAQALHTGVPPAPVMDGLDDRNYGNRLPALHVRG